MTSTSGTHRTVVAAAAGGSVALSPPRDDSRLVIPGLFAAAAAERRGREVEARALIAALRRSWIPASGHEGLAASIQAANRSIAGNACAPAQRPSVSLVAASLAEGHVGVARAGGCAAYVFSRHGTRAITGPSPPPPLGGGAHDPLERHSAPAHPGDVFLLCSREIADWSSLEQVAWVVDRRPDPRASVPALCEIAALSPWPVTIVAFRLGTVLTLSGPSAA